jgi:hypothetical protein
MAARNLCHVPPPRARGGGTGLRQRRGGVNTSVANWGQGEQRPVRKVCWRNLPCPVGGGGMRTWSSRGEIVGRITVAAGMQPGEQGGQRPLDHNLDRETDSCSGGGLPQGQGGGRPHPWSNPECSAGGVTGNSLPRRANTGRRSGALKHCSCTPRPPVEPSAVILAQGSVIRAWSTTPLQSTEVGVSVTDSGNLAGYPEAGARARPPPAYTTGRWSAKPVEGKQGGKPQC